MFSNILSLFILSLVCNLGNTIDSDGTDFVFSYSAFSIEPFSKTASASVVIIPVRNVSTVCSFKYVPISIGRVVTDNVNIIYGETNEFFFKFADVVLMERYVRTSMNDESAADFRIFAHCNEKVKLIGRISDPINSFGDLFLIPSVTFAASKYVIELPTSSDERLGSISFLPVSQTGTIDITAIGYAGRSQYETLRLSYDTTVGSPQYYTSSWFRVFANSSVSITSSSPIMILVTAPFVTISSIPSEYCGESCHQDYVAFMPIGAPFRKCGSKTKNAEERMSTHHFASRMYISPPNELDSCNDNPQITIYDDIDDAAGRAISVSKIGETAISLINKNQTGFLTYGGQMSSYRLGSIVQPDGITAFGHFAHYLPSRAEWISGPTQFYTFAKNCYLEIYISAPVIDLKRVKIDGTPLQNIKHTETPIFMFVVNIMQYVVPIKGYGMHLLENEVGTSVSYVVCKNVNGAFNSAGYLTGFNKIASN